MDLPPPFKASDHLADTVPHLLLACTGSVATIKLPQILHALSAHALRIRVLLTTPATHFLAGQSAEQPTLASLLRIPNVDAIHLDADEWGSTTPDQHQQPWTRGAPILHIELRRWADMCVVAPLSADALAKIVAGIADNLILSVLRAWDTTGLIDAPRLSTNVGQTRSTPTSSMPRQGKKKLVVVAPAMNTAMWTHPVTGKHVAVLEREWGEDVGGWIRVLRPVEKELACGDTGAGAMRDWREIVSVIEDRLELKGLGAQERTESQMVG